VVEFGRRQVIYDEQHLSDGLYLVVRGRVKVIITLENGSQTVTGVIGPDEFFGECALIDKSDRQERAISIENSTVMSWTTAEIEEEIERQPKLGIALMQILVERCLDMEARLESMALDKTPQRVALSLLAFAKRLGTPGADGAVQIPPFTHQLLSEYVGTSREVVSCQMNQLRNLGFLRYSRKRIEIFVDALALHLRGRGNAHT
jgi:CRP-like cAMP-binding protein